MKLPRKGLPDSGPRMAGKSSQESGHSQPEPKSDKEVDLAAYLKDLRWELQTIRKSLEVLRLSETSPLLDEVQSFAARVQLDFLQTVHRLGDDSCGFSRFGDGELRLMLRPEYKLAFQPNSPGLAAELRRILTEPMEPARLLVGFPHVYRDVHWSGVWADIWGQTKPLWEQFPVLGNSHVTRPVFFEFTGDAGVEAWRRVWNGRDVVVITGRNSRFQLVDALFDNIASVRQIDSSPKDAYRDLDRLQDEVLRLGDEFLYLIALGPAGTLLSARLAELGLRGIDIGHISDSYQVAYEGAAWPESKPAIRT